MTIPFACTTPGCDEIVDVSEHTVDGEWFDPEVVVCRDCAEALVPEDVRFMRPASAEEISRMMDEATAGYDADGDLDRFGSVQVHQEWYGGGA